MKGRRELAAAGLILVTLGFAAGSFLTFQQMDSRIDSLEQKVGESQDTIIVNSSRRDFTDLFSEVDDSVVSVRSYGTENSQGSGFVYRSDGYVVTNEHVIEGASRIEVKLTDGRVKDAEVVGKDVYTDLAVLKIDANGLTPLKLANSSEVVRGQRAIAVGNPFGLSGSMTAGIISQKERLLQVEGGFSIPDVMQTDAAINPGNSGGPLMNSKGEVVGVNTAIQSNTGTFSGVGFAVPSNTVSRVVPELIENGEYKHSWIGVSGNDLTPAMREASNLETESGFMVLNVVEDSPADKAGLQGTRSTAVVDGREVPAGGDVVVGIGGQDVRGISDILVYLSQNTRPGDTVDLTVIRDGVRTTIPVELASRQQAD